MNYKVKLEVFVGGERHTEFVNVEAASGNEAAAAAHDQFADGHGDEIESIGVIGVEADEVAPATIEGDLEERLARVADATHAHPADPTSEPVPDDARE